jgi:hypothetical protein
VWKGDVLLVAGKWDEHLIMTNAWPLKWHDKTVIEQILEEVDGNVVIKK